MQIYGKIHKEMREAMQYFASHLFTHQLSRHIDVRVTQKKDLGDIHGQVGIEDYNVLGQPRGFEIELRSADSLEEKILTLAHELVHVRQYCRGQLNEQGNKWYGRRVDVDNIPYNELPWEKEAEEVSEQLYKEFTECHNKK